ncbi:hypothetical protein KO561_07800 [Radiobacillus kanasensis]|uniref:hypothetical protein n=1 Tax=Radiobacillus kanasensis TaxID=2844358 RepID=UPI001E3D4BF3|nr:hypothetical protein [Radiobacillus kanasensis]UFU00825.1 hypothetical protein KO561_07800 [Radiobacillus kanasensis]
MKKLSFLSFVILSSLIHITTVQASPAISHEELETEKLVRAATIGEPASPHHWEKMSVKEEKIFSHSHHFSVLHNFIRSKRECEVYHEIETVVWYCPIHHHTKSNTHHIETAHSEKHD